MPANSGWDLIQRLKVKIVKNPGTGRLNNLNDPVLNVLSEIYLHRNSLERTKLTFTVSITKHALYFAF